MVECLERSVSTFRNFNLCPHCELLGEQGPLGRLCEGLPMISRSDGRLFHLLLADRPVPYPNEQSCGPTRQVSVCFWYSHVCEPQATHSAIVTLPAERPNRSNVFRTIEEIADLLAEILLRSGVLADFYTYRGDSLFELSF